MAVGASWWMARSVNAAMTALRRSGVPFRRKWTPPLRLQAWEGPFTGEEKHLPQHPAVAAKQREFARRWRERKRARALEAVARTREDGAQLLRESKPPTA